MRNEGKVGRRGRKMAKEEIRVVKEGITNGWEGKEANEENRERRRKVKNVERMPRGKKKKAKRKGETDEKTVIV